MKASFFVTLSALCLCAGAAESPYRGNASSFRRHRDVLTAAFDGKYRQVSNPASKTDTSHPYFKVDFGYKRTGSGSVDYYGVSIEECIQYCRNSDSCLAVNYQIDHRNCYELKTLGTVSTDRLYSTILVNYKNGDDPCNDVYSITGHGRWGYFYKVLRHDETPTPKDCCVKCKEDPLSRCKGWSYNTQFKVCHLQDELPPLGVSSQYTTGFGVAPSP